MGPTINLKNLNVEGGYSVSNWTDKRYSDLVTPIITSELTREELFALFARKARGERRGRRVTLP